MKRSLDSPDSCLFTKKSRSPDEKAQVGSQSQPQSSNRRNERVKSSREVMRFEKMTALLKDDVPISLQKRKVPSITRTSSVLVSKTTSNTNSINNNAKHVAVRDIPNHKVVIGPATSLNRKFEKPRVLPKGLDLPASNSKVYPTIEILKKNSVSMKNKIPTTDETLSTDSSKIKPASSPTAVSGSSFEELRKFPRFVFIPLVCICVFGAFWLQRKDHIRSLAATSVNNLSRSRAVKGLITGIDPIHQALPASQIMKLESELNNLSKEISRKRLISESPTDETDSFSSPSTFLVHASGNYLNPFEIDESPRRFDNLSAWNLFNVSTDATSFSTNAHFETNFNIDTHTPIDDVHFSLGDLFEDSITSEYGGNTKLYYPILKEQDFASSSFERSLCSTNNSIIVDTLVPHSVPFYLKTRRHAGPVSIKYFPEKLEPLDIEYSSPFWGATIFSHSHNDDSSLTALSAPFTSPAAVKDSRVSWVKYAGFHNVREAADPSIVLRQRQPQPGECFAMSGSSGAITVIFPRPIVPTSFQLRHIITNHTMNQSLRAYQMVSGSIPINFTMYGWTESPSIRGPFFDRQVSAGRRLYLGTFQYDVFKALEGHDVQNFRLLPLVNDDIAVGVRAVTFFVQSNNGNKRFTCVYRMNVRGKRIFS